MNLAFFAEEVVRAKLNAPPEWKAYRWKMIGQDVCEVTGGIQKATGKKWGGVKKRPHHGKEYAHISEIEVARKEYEKNGDCAECLGTGQLMKSWSSESGTTFKGCSKCAGTGKSEIARGKVEK